MKKLLVCALLLGLLVAVTAPAMAWDASKQKNLGQDANKMQWYLLDYGKDDSGVPYAVSRKYYTNANIKNETIELLMSKFGLSSEVAGALYFTEYGYEYTPDGRQFALTYLRHYDNMGNEIHGTVYDDSTDATKKTFAAVPAGSTPAKAANYIFGTTSSSKSSSTKKSTVPSSRVVRKSK